MDLGKALQQGVKDGKTIFTVWMLEQSDQVQGAARAFGEHMILKEILNQLAQVHQSIKPILIKVLSCYIWHRIEQDLGWFAASGLLNATECQTVLSYSRRACQELAPDVLPLMDCFGIPDAVIQAPIGLDWKKYNEGNNRGEVTPEMNLWK